MGKILKRLYAGDIVPANSEIKGDPEYDELCKKVLLELEAFTKKLDDDMRQEFDKIMEAQLELAYMEKSHSFGEGFSLGVGIVMEALGEDRIGENRKIVE